MAARTSVPTRIAVSVLVALAVITGSITTYLVVRPTSGTPFATGVKSPTPTASVRSPAISALADALAKDVSFDSLYPERYLTDVLPNRLYTGAYGPEATPLAQAVIAGNVVGARLDASGGVSVRFRVTEVLAGTADLGETDLLLPPRFAPDLDVFTSLDSSHPFVVVLDRARSANAVPTVRESGALWIDAENDELSVLSMSTPQSSAFLNGITSLEDIRAEAARPAVIGHIADGKIGA